MNKRILRCLVALCLACLMVAGSALNIFAAREMAYNIYSDPQPDLSADEKKYDTFQIDFMSTQTPTYTYWALANFGLYISPASNMKYKGITGGGGYAGLQDKSPSYGNAAIMAFWEWRYNGDTILRANRIYPYGDESAFGGEGEGHNWITPYGWQDNQWYRMVLRTWTDTQTGTTFAGQWFLDLTSGEWTLISYFDTHLIQSCWTGSMSFFMENFVGGDWADAERDAYLKNIYVRKNSDQQWVSLNTSKLSHCNNGANNKTGKHSFGATEEFFWGKSGGYLDEGVSQKDYDKQSPVSKTYTINQPAMPEIGTAALGEVKLEKVDGVWNVSWAMAEGSTPQLSYILNVKDGDGNSVCSKTETRPEIASAVLADVTTEALYATVTVTDIYGGTTKLSVATDAYKELHPENTEDDTDTSAPETPDNTTEKDDGGNMTVVIIASVIAAVVVMAGVVAGVVIAKKKKK